MRKILVCLLAFFAFSALVGAADEGGNACYAIFAQSEKSLPIEKEFIVSLKPSNPDNPRSGGYAKFRVTLLYNDKGVSKELEAKMDIVRHVINDTTSGFLANDLQGSQGRCKLAMTATASINAILTEGAINGLTFSDFVIQP